MTTSNKHKNGLSKEMQHEQAKKAAAESMVMQTNTDNNLPLKQDAKVAIIGDFAMEPRYQGAGSSMVNVTKLDSITSVIDQYKWRYTGIVQGYQRNGQDETALKKTALDLAAISDAVLFFFWLDEMS